MTTMTHTPTATLNFETERDAINFSASARRAGEQVKRSGNNVTVALRPYQAEVLVRRWAIRRGALPHYQYVW